MEWLNDKQQADIRESEEEVLQEYVELKLQLIQVLHALLAPHLKAVAASDLERLLLHGLPALLQDWLLLGSLVPELHTLCLHFVDAAPHVLHGLVTHCLCSTSTQRSRKGSQDAYQLQRCLENLWWLFCKCLSPGTSYCLNIAAAAYCAMAITVP